MRSGVQAGAAARLRPTGRLSQAVAWQGVVRTSGQVAGERPDPDVGGQARAVLRRVDELLAEAGTSKAHLLSAEVYLADMGDLAAMNAAWDAWVDPAAQPTRVTIQTPMTRPEWRVAIAVTASLPEA